MDWTSWRRHFENNAARPMPPIAVDDAVPEAWREPLARSLATFQVGEAGEGRIATEIDRARLVGIDDDYRASLKLFVREEGRHARILASMVRSLGGELLGRSWTERLFVKGRRTMGVRTKLLCLLTAEVVGIGFYGALVERLPNGPLRAALAQITSDEEAHLDFHREFFRTQTPSRASRAAFVAGWRAVCGSAVALVLADHRHTLHAVGIRPADLARRYLALMRQVEREVLTGPGACAVGGRPVATRPRAHRPSSPPRSHPSEAARGGLRGAG